MSQKSSACLCGMKIRWFFLATVVSHKLCRSVHRVQSFSQRICLHLLAGAAVLVKHTNLVIFEGGPKAQKKLKRLMLHRIKWEEDEIDKRKRKKEKKEESSGKMNKCSLVWEVRFLFVVFSNSLDSM